jgi:hypothetical protein
MYQKIYIMKQFRERKYNEISRNFAKFREIKTIFVVISYSEIKKPISRPP